MNKEEVQQRVLQHGKPLSLDKFTWNATTNKFSSKEDDLVFNFSKINDIKFIAGHSCEFKTGSGCSFYTDCCCEFKTGGGCLFVVNIIPAGIHFTCNRDSCSTFRTGKDCVVIRRDVDEVIKLDGGKKVKLHKCGVKGYEILESK